MSTKLPPKIKSVRVTRYLALDGVVFDTHHEAEMHNLELEIRNEIRDFGSSTGVILDTDIVADFLCKRSAPLSLILRRRVNLLKTKVTKP